MEKEKKSTQITRKIFEVILEELNGYTREQAIEYANENQGSLIWERIEELVKRR